LFLLDKWQDLKLVASLFWVASFCSEMIGFTRIRSLPLYSKFYIVGYKKSVSALVLTVVKVTSNLLTEWATGGLCGGILMDDLQIRMAINHQPPI
jgi:hypothetical protein